MSRWRRIALEKLPELRKQIETGGIYDVWIRLRDELNTLYERTPPDDSLIRRMYEYALWCVVEARNADIASAVIVCFYEHLPTDPPIRRDVARWLSNEDFDMLRPFFGYHLSPEEVEEFAREFRRQKQMLARPGKTHRL